MDVQIPQSTPTPLYRRWYFWIGIVLLLGISIGLTAYSSYQNNHMSTIEKGRESQEENNNYGYNERVVATFSPDSGTAFKYASPMLYNDHLYIGTSERIGYDNAPVSEGHDNFFYKFDLDFDISWQYALKKKMVNGGAVMDSNYNLYFVTELLDDRDNTNKKEQIYSTLYLMSLTEDGAFRWEKQISGSNEMWDHSALTPAISEDDIVYIGHDRFYAFDTEGTLLRQYPDSSLKIIGYSGSPVIDAEGNVFFTSPEPVDLSINDGGGTDVIRTYKFSPQLSSLTWSTIMGNEMLDDEGGNPNGGGGQKARGIESPPALGVDGKVLYGVVGCTISKIDTETGALIWTLKPPQATGHFNASPAIDGENNVYIGTKSNVESRFFAIKYDGTVLWDLLIGSDLYNSPILGDDNTIYVGSETNPTGKFHALDRGTGEEKWAIGKDNETKIPDFTHDGMLLHNGYVYVGVHSAVEGNEGLIVPTLYKIRVDAHGYLPDAPWPRIYGGNDNSGRSN